MKKKIIASVVVVLVAVAAGALWYVNSNKPDIKTSAELKAQELKYADYVDSNKVMSAKSANKLIEKGGNLVIVDISNSADYLLGHVKGAVNVWRPDYSADSGEYNYGGMRASREKMAELLGSLGIDKDTKILIYSTVDNHDAIRFLWQLEMYGHSNAAIIDGGLQGWRAAGLPTTKARPNVTAKEFSFTGNIDNSSLATLEDVKAAINDPNVIIWDTRSQDEYTGQKQLDGAFRKGTIPTSIWMEYKQLIHSGDGGDSTFKTAEELRQMLEAKGITPDKTIIVYCQSGVRSALGTFVLKDLLGYPNVKNYDGSWIEWSYHEDLPIEMGIVN